MQPYLFPYLGYFQIIHSVDIFVIFDDVNYIKRGWINRNNILSKKGIERFNLPVEKASQNRKINQHNIFNPKENISKLFKQIRVNYQDSPQYQQLDTFLSQLELPNERPPQYEIEANSLLTLLQSSIQVLIDKLNLNTQILLSSNIPNELNLSSETRIIDICQQLKASSYINPPNAEKLGLYTPDNFNKFGIKLHYIQPELVEYEQFNSSTFVNYLSILDLIANLPFTEIQNRVTNYNLRLATK
ncbi:WbqC family protein [Psychrosphaera aquimarina]|uniref:WbqC family protein n=1 Tax=Psychrosphaera aquimarina TaxID=2044854 RepID=A0ABU3QZU6_9GAMM|nr:WbqC family protein [Psychrosphaera aquimarina]MDU0112799.1 WbqC family protein [Psychrosphaera aquimarina]